MMSLIRKKRGLITMALVMFVVAAPFAISAPNAQAAEFWKQKFQRFSVTAGETLAIGDVLSIEAVDSRAYKAASNSISRKLAIGVAGNSASAGEKVEVVTAGILAGQTAASAGSRLYISTTAGAFTTTSLGYGQIIGVVLEGTAADIAVSQSTVYWVMILPPVISTHLGY